jgi:hypothetical protein
MPPATKSVSSFLSTLPAEKRKVLSAVRATIRKNLPKGYEEVLQGKLISYVVPLSLSGKTYNGHPLWYAALASQKNYFTLHLMTVYGDKRSLAHIQDGFKRAGKRLDMGKACIRFKKIEDLPLDVIGENIGRMPMNDWIKLCQSVNRR